METKNTQPILKSDKLMKLPLRLLSCLFLAGLILSPRALKAEVISIAMDGNWWSQQSDSSKMSIVEGIVEGLEIGYFHAAANAKNYKSMNISFSKTFQTYVHGVDDFYVNYPKAKNARVGAVVFCQRDNNVAFTCDNWANESYK